jgi:predicted nucleotidyltransferase
MCGLKGHKLRNCCFEEKEIKIVQQEVLKLNPDMIERICKKTLLNEGKWNCKFCGRLNVDSVDCCSFCMIKRDSSNVWECNCKTANSEIRGFCWRCKKKKNVEGVRGWWCKGCVFYNFKERKVCLRCKVDYGEEGKFRMKKYRKVTEGKSNNKEEIMLLLNIKEKEDREKNSNIEAVKNQSMNNQENKENLKKSGNKSNLDKLSLKEKNAAEKVLDLIPEDLKERFNATEIKLCGSRVRLSGRMMDFKMEKESKEEVRLLDTLYKILDSKISIVNERAFKVMLSCIEKKKGRQMDGAIGTCCRSKDVVKWKIRAHIRVKRGRSVIDTDFVERILKEDFSKDEIKRVGTLIGRVSADEELVKQIEEKLEEVGVEFHLRAPDFTTEEDKIISTLVKTGLTEKSLTKILTENSGMFEWYKTESALRNRAKNMSKTKSGQRSLRGLVENSTSNDG